jgi:hypothetical protein
MAARLGALSGYEAIGSERAGQAFPGFRIERNRTKPYHAWSFLSRFFLGRC